LNEIFDEELAELIAKNKKKKSQIYFIKIQWKIVEEIFSTCASISPFERATP
jgi:hypothetical protein